MRNEIPSERRPRITGPGRVLAESGLRPDKRFGQNFLVNQGAMGSIVLAAGVDSRTAVVEIGAGPGNLTERLAAVAGFVTAIELDNRYEEAHRRGFRDRPHVRLVYGDFLEVPLRDLMPPGDWSARVVVGNIPYNITSRILMKLLEETAEFERALILVQREVADRLLSGPGSRQYSVLTVKLLCAFRMASRVRISRRSFLPPPKVDSTLLEFTPIAEPLVPDPVERREFFAMLDGAFSARRKTLVNSLAHASANGWPKAEIAAALNDLGLDAGARTETLSPAELLQLFRRLREKVGPAQIAMRRR